MNNSNTVKKSDFETLKQRVLEHSKDTSLNGVNTQLGWAQGKLNHLLSGNRRISLEDLVSIAATIGVSIQDLVKGLYWEQLLNSEGVQDILNSIQNIENDFQNEHHEHLKLKDQQIERLTNELDQLKKRLNELEQVNKQLNNEISTHQEISDKRYSMLLSLRKEHESLKLRNRVLNDAAERIRRGSNQKAVVTGLAAFLGGVILRGVADEED